MANNGESKAEKIEDKEHKELLALLNIVNVDIERVKQRQWTVTYAVLIAIGGVVGFYSYRGSEHHSVATWGAIVLLVLLLSAGLGHIVWSQLNLCRYRKLDSMYKSKLTDFTKKLLEDERANDPPRWIDPVGLGVAIVIAVLFSLLVVCTGTGKT